MEKNESLKKKNAILISLIIILLIIMLVVNIVIKIKNTSLKKVVGQYSTTYEDGVKINTSKELAKTKQLDNYEITNIKLSYTNGLSTLLADITNIGDAPLEGTEIKAQIVDENGNVLVEITQDILPLNPGQTVELNMNVTIDVADAYNFILSK